MANNVMAPKATCGCPYSYVSCGSNIVLGSGGGRAVLMEGWQEFFLFSETPKENDTWEVSCCGAYLAVETGVGETGAWEYALIWSGDPENVIHTYTQDGVPSLTCCGGQTYDGASIWYDGINTSSATGSASCCGDQFFIDRGVWYQGIFAGFGDSCCGEQIVSGTSAIYHGVTSEPMNVKYSSGDNALTCCNSFLHGGSVEPLIVGGSPSSSLFTAADHYAIVRGELITLYDMSFSPANRYWYPLGCYDSYFVATLEPLGTSLDTIYIYYDGNLIFEHTTGNADAVEVWRCDGANYFSLHHPYPEITFSATFYEGQERSFQTVGACCGNYVILAQYGSATGTHYYKDVPLLSPTTAAPSCCSDDRAILNGTQAYYEAEFIVNGIGITCCGTQHFRIPTPGGHLFYHRNGDKVYEGPASVYICCESHLWVQFAKTIDNYNYDDSKPTSSTNPLQITVTWGRLYRSRGNDETSVDDDVPTSWLVWEGEFLDRACAGKRFIVVPKYGCNTILISDEDFGLMAFDMLSFIRIDGEEE